MFQTILDIIYPVRCPICGDIVIPKGEKICSSCRDKLPYIKEPRCMKCSKPLELQEKEYCSDCERKKYNFDKGYAVWVYNEDMRHSIAYFKYNSKKEYAKFYIEEMLCYYSKHIEKLAPDVIVPIPIHRSKYLERGFNQADILAKGIGKELGLPVLSKLLIRNKKTLPQKKLSDKERLKNLQEAFQFNKKEANSYDKKVTKVLLIDDIYTTGSTMEACTNVLKSNGITQVYFLVLCIGKGF
ncbi:MAG: ComF family protein [Herbinix sp.]|nr:ComF family protein [Herbinix sp.]